MYVSARLRFLRLVIQDGSLRARACLPCAFMEVRRLACSCWVLYSEGSRPRFRRQLGVPSSEDSARLPVPRTLTLSLLARSCSPTPRLHSELCHAPALPLPSGKLSPSVGFTCLVGSGPPRMSSTPFDLRPQLHLRIHHLCHQIIT